MAGNGNGSENHILSKRNFALGIVNGSLQQFGGSLVDTQTVLAVFVLDLMRGHNAIIWLGLLNSLIQAGWFWPGALLANRMETAERLQPWYQLSAALRIISKFAIWFAVALVRGSNPLLLFVLLAVLNFVFASVAGLGLIPFMSVVTDTIPATWRGKFMATRWLIGSGLGFCAGLYVKHLLAANGTQLWQNYAWLFLLSAIFFSAGSLTWCFAVEPPHTAQSRLISFRKQFFRGPRAYRRDKNFRRLIRQRVLSGLVASFTFPFVTPYAISHHLAAKDAAGAFLAATVVGLSFSNVLWGYISDRWGNRLLLVITTAISAVVPVLILLTPLIPPMPLSWGGSAMPTLTVAYLLFMFVMVGACQSGMDVGQTNYLLEVSPPPRRATYIGFYYTVLVPVSFAPFVGSLIIGSASHYALGFALASLLGIGALVNGINMGELREEESEEHT